MKVVQQMVEKPRYLPITITLETAEEYFSLLAALGSTTYKGEVQELTNMGVGVVEGYDSPSDELHTLLQSYFDKVKETL
jgi:hypothetical protein